MEELLNKTIRKCTMFKMYFKHEKYFLCRQAAHEIIIFLYVIGFLYTLKAAFY